MNYFMQTETALIWTFNGEKLQIEAWGSDSLRIRCSLGTDIIENDFALLPAKKCKPAVIIEGNTASITNGKITAKVVSEDLTHSSRVRQNGQITFYNEHGEVLLKEIGFGGRLKRKARNFITSSHEDYRISMSFEGDDQEKIYGMGQYQEKILDLKGTIIELAQRNSQASVPFMISSKGYGLLWHNPAIGKVTFGKNITEWEALSSDQIDYWITAGDTPKEISRNYAQVTGFVPMMPEYAMGFWQCRLRYYNENQVLEVAKEYRKRGLPLDVLVVDFFHWPKQGDFRFDEEFFPNAEMMIRELKKMNIELIVSIWPQIDFKSENYEEMRQKGLLVRTNKGLSIGMQFQGDTQFFDPTNPEARKYVWDKCKKNYFDKGIRQFWLDEAEPEYTVYDFDNYRYKMGQNIKIGNIFPQMYSRGFYEGLKTEGITEIMNLVRCAWAGSQRYGALVWSGDVQSTFDSLQKQICAGLNIGMAGIPWWTTDIGGFIGGDPEEESFRELLIRWFQFGTFCPVMRLHGERQPITKLFRENGEEILYTGADNEIWSYGDDAYQIMKKYLFVREELKTYIKRIMKEASESGIPVMRSMFYEFPDDDQTSELMDQYMFGSDLLVAPIIKENDRQRTVYLPQDVQWIHASSGECFTGGQVVSIKAEIEDIPIFVREDQQEEFAKVMSLLQIEE